MPSIQQLIRDIAQRYNLPPEYLLGKAYYESKLDPNAISPTGARGLFQFTNRTGKQYGLDRRSAFDPERNTDAAARFTQDNVKQFERRMGRKPTSDEMYLMHLQGASGAMRGMRNPDARAVDVFGYDKVKSNLPKSARGQLDTISASDFQNLHRGNIKNAMGRFKGENIDIGDSPTLAALNPPKSTTTKPSPAAGVAAQVLKEITPADQVSEMARSKYPGFDEAIKRSMTNGGTDKVQVSGVGPIAPDIDIRGNVRTAGFVPPGLTRGATTTRRAANANVADRASGIAAERGAEKGTPYDRSQPSSRGMEGSYGDYVTKEQERMWLEKYIAWRNDAGAHPGPSPKSLSEEDINKAIGGPGAKLNKADGAADFKQGTALQRTDPNLAAQNDPAGQAMVAAKIRGYAMPPGAPPGGTSSTTINAGPGGVPNLPKAAAAGAAVAAGVSAGLDGNERVQQGHDAARGRVPQGANVDPGVAAFERQMNLPPGTLTSPQAGMVASSAIPIMREVMSDPQAGPAAQVVLKKAAEVKARQDGMRADMAKDPTFYQMQAAQRQQMPGGGGGGDPLADRAMERAVMMDNPRTSARGVPQRGVPAAQAPQQTTAQQIVEQNLEKGDVPPGRTPVPPGYPQDQPATRTQRIPPTMGGAADPRGAEAYPIGPGSNDPTGGVQGMPSSGQMPMDPAMMQLMQFFTGGGGVG